MTLAHDIKETQSCKGQESPLQDSDSACCGGQAVTSAGITEAAQVSSSDLHRYVFKVQGLDCAEEVATLRRGVGPLVGGEDKLAFDVLNGRMMVLKDAEQISADAVREAVRSVRHQNIWDI
ncbi:MAG: hypothetical protein OXQ30_04485 [Boseongicola sp.]|nr:hypothetical protein [Boseongicola sp.]